MHGDVRSTEDKLVRVSIGGLTDTTIDIQDTFDEDGEIENSSDGGHTTEDGGCREQTAAKSLKQPPAPPPHPMYGPSLHCKST